MAKKELITEADVRRMPRGGELVLGAGRIATPSALDAAYERGMRVVHRAVRYGAGAELPAAGVAGAGGDGDGNLLARMCREDGTYVVEVRAGRATVTRLTASGPVAFGAGTAPGGA